MKVLIDSNFIKICKKIVNEKKNIAEWIEIESDDQFCEGNFVGGFDSIEREFCFSYYTENNQEYWFQIKLEDIEKIILRQINQIEVRKAE